MSHAAGGGGGGGGGQAGGGVLSGGDSIIALLQSLGQYFLQCLAGYTRQDEHHTALSDILNRRQAGI